MPWISVFVQSYCGDCDWNQRAEDPDQAVSGRIALAAYQHRELTGHNAVTERGQIYRQPPSRGRFGA